MGVHIRTQSSPIQLGWFAAGLASRGLHKGDLFLIHLGNCAEFLIAWHACSRLGVVAVTTNTRSSSDELSYFAENCGAVAALTQPALVDVVATSASALRFIVTTDRDQGAPASPFRTAGGTTIRRNRWRPCQLALATTRWTSTVFNTPPAPRRVRKVSSGHTRTSSGVHA